MIRDWKINPEFLSPVAANLSEVGRNELRNLATRLRKAFPTLLPEVYSPSHYFIRLSPVLRTNQSAHAFAEGLFGKAANTIVNYEAGQTPDRYLYPFGTCSSWNTFAANSSLINEFVQTTVYQQMVRDVNNKLGFYGSQQLDDATVNQLLTHCRYETLDDPTKLSAFCAAFSLANHQVNEYYTDLTYYYLFGYGNPQYRALYENMSCYLLKALLQFLQSNNPTDQKAKLWFAHDANLQLLFVALGLYEDKIPLSASNFAQQTERKWKSGQLTPMGGNVVIVRFE